MVNVISLFCGCGGSSLGYKRANCDIRLATDFNPIALQTYNLNFPQTQTLQENIRKISGNLITKLTNIESGELDILDGSPPCTPFSTAGKREKSWNKAYRHVGERTVQITNDLFYEYIRLVAELKPKTFVAENVRGLIIGKSKGYFLNITSKLKEIGYDIQAFDINSKDFEVAQSRPRIIITGIRNDIKQSAATKLTKHKEISFYEAIRNVKLDQEELKQARNSITKSIRFQFISKCKQGQGVNDYHFANEGFNYNKVRIDKPIPTIVAHSNMLMHPTEQRYLTLAELKRCASFPDDFKFISNHDGKVRIGNSVPPNLIKNIALYIIERANLAIT